MRKELLIGCGSRPVKALHVGGNSEWSNLTTLDINPDHKPTVVWDLENLPLPFPDETFDEIHAYEVLEHTGRQGDYKFFFAQFNDFWRMLKPNGYFMGSVPNYTSIWQWSDPSHTRVISIATLTFLSQRQYEEQVGVTTMTDFRYIYHGNFEMAGAQETDHSLYFILRVIK